MAPEFADQNTDHPIRELSSSSAAIPARELPAAFSSGDHTHTVNCPGTIATIPPPTPLLPGKPTLKAIPFKVFWFWRL